MLIVLGMLHGIAPPSRQHLTDYAMNVSMTASTSSLNMVVISRVILRFHVKTLTVELKKNVNYMIT